MTVELAAVVAFVKNLEIVHIQKQFLQIAAERSHTAPVVPQCESVHRKFALLVFQLAVQVIGSPCRLEQHVAFLKHQGVASDALLQKLLAADIAADGDVAAEFASQLGAIVLHKAFCEAYFEIVEACLGSDDIGCQVEAAA